MSDGGRSERWHYGTMAGAMEDGTPPERTGICQGAAVGASSCHNEGEPFGTGVEAF